MSKPTVAIDFDGTVVEDAWPELGEWKPDAVESLRAITEFARPVIWTCRIAPSEPDGVTRRPPALVQMEVNKVRELLDSVGLHNVPIWDHRFTPWKPSAAAYVDNKAVRYTGRKGSWKALVHKLATICNHPNAMMYDGYTERS